MRHSSEIDMCSGPLAGSLLRFSIPLMASSILQLLFNAADIIVLGQFASSSAMAAVGATSSLNSLMVNLFLGLSIGCSVVMARSYGAQDWQRVHDTVHTALLLAVCCGAVLILAGVPLLPALLRWMDTPPDLLDQSVLYMRIVFLGMPAMMIYDFGAGILRAIGDTQRPLFFLTAAGVTNACLNVFFVVAFHLDVAGVALATSLSQYLSAFLVVRCLMQPDTRYQLRLRELKISALTVKKAYDYLEEEGLVVTVHGKGSFIAQANQGLLMEERRKELEKDLEQAVRKARCGGLTDEEIRELFQLIMEE